MSSTFVQVTGYVGRKFLTALVLSFIGLLVGIGCVLLPPAAPFAVVGIAVMLLLWTMPELRVVPYRWSRFMVPVMFVVYTCVPVYYAIILPGIPWIQLRRVALFAWLIPLLIVICGSTAARQRISVVMRESPWLATFAVGFIVMAVVTTPTAVYFSISVNYVFNSFINYFIPMFGVILLVRDKTSIITLFKVLIWALAFNFVIGAIEFRLQHPFLIYALPTYMRDQIFATNSIAADMALTGQGMRGGMYRASSTLTNSLSWGEVCAMFLPFALHFLAHGRTTSEKWLGAVGAALSVLSIVLSGSRGAYVALIAAAVCYSMCWSLRSSFLRRSSLAGMIGLTLYSMAAAVTILAIFFVGRVRTLVLGGYQAQGSTDARYAEWALAKPKILERPVLGWGGGSSGDIIHYPTSHGGFTVDGYHMNLLVEYGIPGFIFFFALFILAVVLCTLIYIKISTETAALGNAFGSSLLAFIVYRTTLSQGDSLPLAFMLVGLVFVFIDMIKKEQIETNLPIQSADARLGSTSLDAVASAGGRQREGARANRTGFASAS